MDGGGVSLALSLTTLKSHIIWKRAKFIILLGAAPIKKDYPPNVTAVEAISINQIPVKKAIWEKMRLKSALQNKIDVEY